MLPAPSRPRQAGVKRALQIYVSRKQYLLLTKNPLLSLKMRCSALPLAHQFSPRTMPATQGLLWESAGGNGRPTDDAVGTTMPEGEKSRLPCPPERMAALKAHVKRTVVQMVRRRQNNGEAAALGLDRMVQGGEGARKIREQAGAEQVEATSPELARPEVIDALKTKQGKDTQNQRKRRETFEERLEELAAYREVHGHIKVTPSVDKRMYQFCADARRARRGKGNMKLTKERIASLDALGKSFQERVEELKAFKEEHGHLVVKKSKDKSLAQFCYAIRRARRHPGKRGVHKLTEERIAALDALGFYWAPAKRSAAKMTNAEKDRIATETRERLNRAKETKPCI